MNGTTNKSQVYRAISELEKAIQEINKLRDLIDSNYERANSSNIAEEERISASLTLSGLMLLYEGQVRPLISRLPETSEKITQPQYDQELPKLTLALDGEWVTHELSRLLGALNYTYNFISLTDKIKSKEASYRLLRPQQRSYVYREARLYFYLERNEELHLSKIHISSPGMVEFILAHVDHGAMLLSILILLSRGSKIIDSLITRWARIKDTLRDQRYKNRLEIIDREIETYFHEHVIPAFKSADSELNTEILQTIQKSIAELSKMKLSDPIALTDHILRAFAVLAHLKSAEKYQVINPDANDKQSPEQR